MSKSNSFFDDSKFDKGREAVESAKYIPKIFASTEGNYIFRPYLEDTGQEYRFMRTVYNNQLHNNIKVIAPPRGEDNKVDNLALEYKQKGLSDAWKNLTRTDGVMLVYLIKAPKKYESHEGSVVSLVLSWQHRSQWINFENNFDPVTHGMSLKDFMKAAHSFEGSPGIRMHVSREKKKRKTETIVNFEATRQDIELPPLEDALEEGVEFEGLDSLYIPHDKVITDKYFMDFKEDLEDRLIEALKFKSQNQFSPETVEESDRGYIPSTREKVTDVEDEDAYLDELD